MNENSISVVMATYNGSVYIREQIESLLHQTVLPLEIIISDDGSSDNTLDIVKSYQNTCTVPIKIIINEVRLGFRNNFLHAASKASGRFIAFCDQDDIWDTKKLEQCTKYANDKRISLIVHSAITIDSKSNEVGRFTQGIKCTRVLPPLSYDPWGTFWGFSIVFRRELLNLYPIEDRFIDYIAPQHLIAHDRWIMFLGQIVGATVEINESLVAYRQHDKNLYGIKKSRAISGSHLLDRSAVYIESTAKMVEIVKQLSVPKEYGFDSFDRDRSIKFFDHALNQVKKRDRVYNNKSRLHAIILICLFTVQGVYINFNTKGIRWKSLLRDFKFVILRR